MNKIFKILILIAFSVFAGNSPQVWGKFFSGVQTANFTSYTQFLRYLENSNTIGELKYIFNANKVNEATVKNAFKDLFTGSKKNEIFNTIWNNPSLRGSLFDLNSNIAPMQQFENLINTPNSILYTFIKAE